MSGTEAVAIDGPVASGKTVVGRLVAKELGFTFLDTGLMYRAVTWMALKRKIDISDHEALTLLARQLRMRLEPVDDGERLVVDGQDIDRHLRLPPVEREVSLVSMVRGVREAMVRKQRAIAAQGPIVMAGRDIGTVVLPDASLKVYITASAEVRGRRRHTELQELEKNVQLEEVVRELKLRDKIDSERAHSPLRPAAGAVQIATEHLAAEQAARKIVSLVRGG